MSVNIFGRSIQFCLFGDSLGRSRDTAGDTENFILVVLFAVLSKVYKSGKTNRAAETYDRRFADTKFGAISVDVIKQASIRCPECIQQ